MLKIQYIEENKLGRDFVIGDLHGCVDSLYRLMDRVKFNKEIDRIFSVGDLVGRGPKPLESFELINEPWFYAVRGNHEIIIRMHAMHGLPINHMVRNGEYWFCRLGYDIQQGIAKQIDLMPDVIVVGKGTAQRFNVFHAEFIGSDEDLESGQIQYDSQGEDRIHWGRDLVENPNSTMWKQVKLSRTFVGHTIFSRPFQQANVVYLDTGAYRQYRPDNADGYLTMINAIDLSIQTSEGLHAA